MVSAARSTVEAAAPEGPFALTLADGRRVVVLIDEAGVRLIVDGAPPVAFARPERGVFVAEGTGHEALPPEALLPLLANAFSRRPRLDRATVTLCVSNAWAADAVRAGVVQSVQQGEGGALRLVAAPGAFWQHPALWLTDRASGAAPLDYVLTDGKRHPRRGPKPTGEVYRRHMPRFSADFSIRALDLDRDLKTFNQWMNLDSVAEFWNERGDEAKHRDYLEGLVADPHMTSLIGCFDDEPFAYFEMYWAKEDRVAPFYDADDYDRGLHLLVGDPKHQGPGKVEAWFRAVIHYMFLDDPRTRRCVGDPRVDHVRWIEYMQKQGFVRLKEFDLPHKRSELIYIERETFFGRPWSGPV